MNAWIQSLQAWGRGFRWSRLPGTAQRELAFWAVVAGGLFFLFHLHGNSQEVATCRHSLFLWLRSRWVGDYAYCQLLPLASLAALWLRRRELAAAPRIPDWRGAAVVAAGLFLHWAGVLAQQPRISAAGLIVLLWGLPFLLYGWALARWLLFPCGYLFLAIPLNFIDSLTAPLRQLATFAAAGILNGFGLEVQRVGAGLFSGAGNAFAFNVADCTSRWWSSSFPKNIDRNIGSRPLSARRAPASSSAGVFISNQSFAVSEATRTTGAGKRS